MAIRVMDMFCGISAFRSAAEKIGGFEFVGYCECDSTAIAAYRTLYHTEGEYFCNDARAINTDELPDFDLLVGGFPCQDYPEKRKNPKNLCKALNRGISQKNFGIIISGHEKDLRDIIILQDLTRPEVIILRRIFYAEFKGAYQ